MNSTASTRIVLFTTLILVTAGAALAATPQANGDTAPGATGGVHATTPSAQDKGLQAADLLRRARLAMAENDMVAAEALIAQAEALGVEYGSFHLGDTPKKARRDLERKRSAAGPTKPSQLFSSSAGSKKNAPASDPFAVKPNDMPLPLADAKQVTPLPNVANGGMHADTPAALIATSPQTGSGKIYPSTEPNENDLALPAFLARDTLQPARAAGNDLRPGAASPLLAARRALAVGDIRRASEFVKQAPPQSAGNQPGDDSPEKVEAAIRKMQDVASVDKNTEAYRRAYARNLAEQAEALLRYGELDEAERLATVAANQQVSYNLLEMNPRDLLSRITAMRSAYRSNPVRDAVAGEQGRAAAAVYDPANDITRTVKAASEQIDFSSAPRQNFMAQTGASALPPPPIATPETATPTVADDGQTAGASALSLFQQGEAALRARDREKAYQLFIKAAARKNELDPAVAQRLQDHLQLLSSPQQHAGAQGGGQPSTLLDETAGKQQVLARQVAADLAHMEANARATRESDPKGALSLLEEGRKKVENAGLEPSARDQLLRRVDRAINETKQFITENQPRLDLAEKNNRTRQEIDREQRVKIETQEKVAKLVDDFNRLRDEQRYAEAQVAAKQAAQLDPNNPVTQQLLTEAKFLYRVMSNNVLKDKKEEAVWKGLDNVEQASIFPDDLTPYVMPDAKVWGDLTRSRAKLTQAERRRNRTEKEIDIEKKLKTPVSLEFTNAPLSKVVDYLGKIAEINLYLDPKGLAEEGVSADTPVTIEVPHQTIMLKSALNLVLQPLHLSYVIKDEVLKITSEQGRDNQVFTVAYPVADLTIPIPNFVNGQMGLASAYHEAMGTIGFGGVSPFGAAASPLTLMAGQNGKGGTGTLGQNVLAQPTSPHATANPHSQGQQPIGSGPGGLGGGSQADFDSLINLITATIKPTTWDNVGGPGSIQPFETNLSIVVSNTQDVHDEIVDLLEQLRRMQDLQVTIEVRFITLTDDFFERIGVSFDFNIHNTAKNSMTVVTAGAPASGTEPVYDTLDADRTQSMVVGMSQAGNSPAAFNSDMDIPFTQNSYGLAVPQFGGFDATAGATLGFAILSDIEAYFFINAAQGDKRTNVLQAPKVTLFNGQSASVSDSTQVPFVTSVVPVVGDFAAAYQPVIMVLNEGTSLTVQAVISNDRRFVRLTVVPYFSNIGTVNTFSFTGSTSTSSDTSTEGIQATPDDATKANNITSKTTSGVTVQLPTYSYLSVSTTVSVPDGGTVLLGGIKRLSEGRNEYGVPILNKIPYLNRLFKNAAVGRTTQSLMMMVTPRIIIQEEEEEKLGVISE